MRLPFFGGEYKGASTEANPQECVNLIAEIDKTGGYDILSIRPGLSEVVDLTTEELGDDLINNGTFDSDTQWTYLADVPQWSITGGKLTRTPTNEGSAIYGDEIIANGTFAGSFTGWGGGGWTYDAVSGNAKGYVFGSANGPHQDRGDMDITPEEDATYGASATIYSDTGNLGKTVYLRYYDTEVHVVSSSVITTDNPDAPITIDGTIPVNADFQYIEVWFDAPANGQYYYCTKVSMKKILGYTSSGEDSVEQLAADMAGSLVDGVTYKLDLTVESKNAGYFIPVVANNAGDPITSSGSHSCYITASSSGGVRFNASSRLSVSIDDVSIAERIIPHDSIRGMHVMGDYVYVVHGDQLKRLDASYTATSLTDSTNKLSTSSGPVTMAHINNASGGLQLMICDGSDGVAYIYDTTTALFTRLTTAEHSFYGGGSVTAQDSMFISNRPNTPEFYISATQDGLTWDILDVHTAEAKTSNIVRVLSVFQKLWVTKGDSTEEFYDSGGDPVWQRSSLALMELGTLAAHSWALVDNALFWLAHDKTVRSSRGSSDAQIVSTPHISRMIETMSDATDAIGYGFVQNGHSYYVLTFPTANQTLVYDLSNGIWYSWESYTEDGIQDDGRFRGNCYAEFNGVDLVGDYSNNKIYKIDSTVYTDDGNRIRQMRIFPIPNAEEQYIPINEIELDVNTGIGIYTGQGSAPQAMLQVSRDGGKTYGNEMWTDIGAMGDYEAVCSWRRLGMSKNTVLKITISDPIPAVWRGAYLNP